MNPAIEIISEVKASGAAFVVEGDRLGVRGQIQPDTLAKAKCHKSDILAFLKQAPELPSDEEQRIRTWLDYIEENDQESIAEVLEKCRRDMDARRYFLKWTEEVPACVATVATIAVAIPRWVTCGDCAHYRRTDHPHLGHCAAGEPENVAGLWDSDRRECDQYKTGNVDGRYGFFWQ